MSKVNNCKNAIILCSGGLDSAIAAFYAKNKLKYKRFKILFFDYRQKSLKQERRCSKMCAKALNADFIEIKLDWLGKISSSPINKEGEVKKLNRKDLKNTSEESKKFYVPCRNTIFLTNALALAESLWIKDKEKYDILVGFKCEGKESYPDATKEFVQEMNKLSKIGCSKYFKIISPLIEKDKEDIILIGKELKVNLADTFSCYVPIKGKHCGYCLACKLRKEGFYWANTKDTTKYVNN